MYRVDDSKMSRKCKKYLKERRFCKIKFQSSGTFYTFCYLYYTLFYAILYDIYISLVQYFRICELYCLLCQGVLQYCASPDISA